MLMVGMLIKMLLCLGAHAQMRAYSSLVVFLSVCYRYICSPGEIQVLIIIIRS